MMQMLTSGLSTYREALNPVTRAEIVERFISGDEVKCCFEYRLKDRGSVSRASGFRETVDCLDEIVTRLAPVARARGQVLLHGNPQTRCVHGRRTK